MSKRRFRTARDHRSADDGERADEAARLRRQWFKTIAKQRRQSLEGRDFSDSTNLIRRYRDGMPP